MQLHGFAAGPYQTNTFVIINEGKAGVVDPGMHASKQVIALLEDTGAELSEIVCTHGHIDHTREAGDLAKRFDVPVHLHPADEFMLQPEGIMPQSRVLFDVENLVPIADLRPLADAGTVSLAGVEFRTVHAPGHSPGSVLLVHDEICFTGDVLFKGAIGRTDFPTSSPEDMDASLRGPVWELADTLQLFPGHGPATTMRAERQTNPFLLQLGR
ncbi:MBL fold metallo-hydrolase [Corynebacterium sp.]|uniref:MBL fold metallo-hydrolase n=1 Tax=Corynebacterium sp. TaxID=1720 RepID=UPI0026DFC34D|nr:MBL fold metallo-hydrolase [Corynebacterium sp.]MDO5511821.1 MBL fold metallo-hydrolase [Corynebacterium sp.]